MPNIFLQLAVAGLVYLAGSIIVGFGIYAGARLADKIFG